MESFAQRNRERERECVCLFVCVWVWCYYCWLPNSKGKLSLSLVVAATTAVCRRDGEAGMEKISCDFLCLTWPAHNSLHMSSIGLGGNYSNSATHTYTHASRIGFIMHAFLGLHESQRVNVCVCVCGIVVRNPTWRSYICFMWHFFFDGTADIYADIRSQKWTGDVHYSNFIYMRIWE